MAKKGHKLSEEFKARLRAIRLAQIPPFDVLFWSKVDKSSPTGCWIWTAALRHGHGTTWLPDGWGKRLDYTHRVVYKLLGREIPEGMEVDHVCRERRCCNPDHLRFVTKAVNSTENNLSPFAKNRRKTHCKNGHAFEGDNFVWFRRPMDHGPVRTCAICRPHSRNSKYRIPPPPNKEKREVNGRE